MDASVMRGRSAIAWDADTVRIVASGATSVHCAAISQLAGECAGCPEESLRLPSLSLQQS
jgi:hypothetical protein